jgi:hypothetical protein
MGRFLDQRSSENSSFFGNPDTAVPAAPVLWGVVGLQTQGVANPIVNLSGTIGLSTVAAGSTVLVTVNRGTLVTDPIIYTAVLTSIAGPVVYSFNVQDLAAPAAAQTAYSTFVSTVSAVAATRSGPEVFYGIASATI